MANKETKAERREAARRARLEAQRRAQARSRRRKMWAGLVGLLAIGGIVAAVLLSGRAERAAAAELEKLAEPAGCAVPEEQPNEGAQHIEPPETVEYDTDPPTSGNHYINADSPARTGVHQAAIPSESQVHNLEHGHVGIQYNNDLPIDVITALEEVARANTGWVFMAPRTTMDVPLAFTSWTWLSQCETPGSVEEVKAFASKFVDVRKDKAPESRAGSPL